MVFPHKGPVTRKAISLWFRRKSNVLGQWVINTWNRPISQIPQCIRLEFHHDNAPICNRNVHTFLLQNGALWDIGLVRRGSCAMGLLRMLADVASYHYNSKLKSSSLQVLWWFTCYHMVKNSKYKKQLRLWWWLIWYFDIKMSKWISILWPNRWPKLGWYCIFYNDWSRSASGTRAKQFIRRDRGNRNLETPFE